MTQPVLDLKGGTKMGIRKKVYPLLLAIIFLIGTLGPTAQPTGVMEARAHTLLTELAAESPGQTVAVIVQKLTHDQIPESWVTARGGTVTKNLPVINGFAASMSASAAYQLAQHPDVRWVSLDAPVLEAGIDHDPNTVQLQMDFNQTDFSDQTSNWIQPWVEIGEADGAEAGDVAITSFLSGELKGVRLQAASRGIQSAFELPQTDTASMSIGFRRKGFNSELDYVSIQISTNAGSDWFEIDRLAGPITDPTLSYTQYDLNPYIPGEVHLRFITSDGFDPTSKFYLDFVQIEYRAALKPAPDFAYAVRLPMVVNLNPDTALEEQYSAPEGVTFNYSQNVRDEFTTASFSGSYGNSPWKGDWIEFDAAGAGSTTGNVTISNGELLLADRPDTGTQPSMTREADLSSAIAAIFSFDYHTTTLVDADDAVVVEISRDDGLTFTVLQTYTGINGDVWDSGHFDISRYLGTDTQIRFRVLANYGGDAEYFVVDNVQIAYASRLGSTVRDEFTQQVYTNNHGSSIWANNWVEYDPSGGGSATAGYIRISATGGGRLQFYYLWNENIQRSVSLAGSTTAYLSFNWQTVGLDVGERLAVLISSDGVSPFVEIGSFGGSQTGSAYIDISAYISSNTTLKFANTGEYWESGEYTYIDYVQIAYESSCPECFSTANLASSFPTSLGAEVLWNESSYLQGQNVTVAVVDSGIAPHQDFLDENGQSRILTHVQFLSQGSSSDDFYGHGTHVAGSIAGNGISSDGRYPGIAPKANLIDVKVMDDQGIGTTSDVVAGLQWIMENKDQYNIRIVNLSLNSTVEESYHTSALDAALEVLWFNGIVVIVSAGNNGVSASGVVYPPANDPFVITVGAADDMGTSDISDDNLASFSAFGVTADNISKPDIIVPGRNIISLLASDDCNLVIAHPDHAVQTEAGTFYFRISGTSMASGVAAGAVALLMQDEPTLSPDQVKSRLLDTASPFPYGNGAGYVDIYAAVHSDSLNAANTGLTASQLLWTGSDPITWGSVAWNSVAWNSVAWNSVAWNSVAWNSVAWNSVSWEP